MAAQKLADTKNEFRLEDTYQSGKILLKIKILLGDLCVEIVDKVWFE